MMRHFDVFFLERTIEQVIELSVIWDTTTFMWRHFNAGKLSEVSFDKMEFTFRIAIYGFSYVYPDRMEQF